jgi:hypothetical protein
MHWTLPQLRALSRNDYDVLVTWLTEQQRAAALDIEMDLP